MILRAHSILLTGILLISADLAVRGADWPQWGRDNSRNMVGTEKDLPTAANPGGPPDANGAIDLSGTQNVRWIAKLGSAAYGNPTVAGGRVFIGTNNASPRVGKYSGDFGILLCLDEKTGKFLWQLAVPKLKAGKVSDWEQVGLCSSPTVDGGRVYVVTNRCEVLCLAVYGRTGSQNRGPFVDEAQYTAGPGGHSIDQGPGDADILWRYDMRDELGVFPHNMTSSSVLVCGDKLFVTTSNGVDWTGKHLPAPDAPALICLDKISGKLLGRERSGISARTWVCNWSSPAFGEAGGKPTVVFGGGDGFCYGFDPTPDPGPDGIGTIRELWRFDCNPPGHRVKDGKPIKYGLPEGPSEVLATPVIYQNRVYVSVGQEPEEGDGVGSLNCIDPSRDGDISQSGLVWRDEKIGRSLSTVSIADGLLYVAEFSGVVHCLDLASGAEIWNHDTEAHIWGCTLLDDGKIFVGNESGVLTILAAGREKKLIASIDMKDPIYSTPIAANGALLLATQSQLFSLQNKERGK